MEGSDDGDACGCKVGRVAGDRRLAGIHDDLAARWTDDGGESVRELAARFNRRVLRSALEASGRSPIDGEVANLYRVLTDADDASGTRARERLRRDGVPVEEIESAFVSHQTIYRHLVGCLDLTSDSPDAEDLVENWRDRIQSLRGRTERVTGRGVEQLRSAGAVEVGSAEVLVDVNVVCEDCGGFYSFQELLDGDSCDCGTDPVGPGE